MSSYLFFSELTLAKVQRLSSQFVNLSKPLKVYVHPGRVSLLEFPCHIEKTVMGSSSDLKVHIVEKYPKQIFLWLKNYKAQSTNLIINCEKKVFIIDILASHTNHQDYVKILSSFEVPKIKAKKIDGSRMKGRSK